MAPGRQESREILDRLEEIAREAGRVLLSHYGRVAVERKDGGEPVTAADGESNALIVARLGEAFPDDGIVAEESAVVAPSGSGRTWMVDPLDGTKEFIAANGEFCLMIGLVVSGRPVLGVVYRPTDDLLYRGGAGVGAVGTRGGETLPLAVSEVEQPSSMTLVMSRSHRDERFERMTAALGIRERVISGSVGLKAGLVCEGAADLYLHPSRGTKLWDTAAPEALVTAAGGRVTDFDGRPLAYDPRRVEHLRGLVVGNGRRHDDLVRRLQPLFPPDGGSGSSTTATGPDR